MAVEKDKVLAAIETKFKGKSITKTFKENIAAKWAAKIETEDDIETYIEDREDVILEAASEADRRATEAGKKAAEKSKQEPDNKKDDEPKDELPADTPEWAKALIKKNEALEAKINGFEQANKQKTIAERFKSDERLKGIPEFMIKGRIPQSEDDLETAITELATEFDAYAKEQNITRFGNDTPAGATGGNKGGKKEASKEEIDALSKQMGI